MNGTNGSIIILSLQIIILIIFYDALSIGLTFFQKYFIKDFHYPLTIVIGHVILKFIYASFIRKVLIYFSNRDAFHLDMSMYWKTVMPTGISSGLDVGLSNWSFEFITVSLYTMSKSSCIIFIFIFSIFMRLDSLKITNFITVLLIAIGLFLFTYHSTQFNWKGFILVMIAAMVGGVRWSLAQLVTQHKKFAIKNPLDVIFYVQPWMLTILMPLAFVFEREFYGSLFNSSQIAPLITSHVAIKIFIGSLIAFGMEISEYLLVMHTSGLTLGISGILKEILTLYLAAKYNGDQFSRINFGGLVLCLLGISLHVLFKFIQSEPNDGEYVKTSKTSYLLSNKHQDVAKKFEDHYRSQTSLSHVRDPRDESKYNTSKETKRSSFSNGVCKPRSTSSTGTEYEDLISSSESLIKDLQNNNVSESNSLYLHGSGDALCLIPDLDHNNSFNRSLSPKLL
ncbi:unnamed protein product [Gordionus sp. m RMFG-2023]